MSGDAGYQMKHDKLGDLGAFAFGAVEVTASSHPSVEVREFAQQQLDHWVRHGLIDPPALSTSGEVKP